MNGKIRRLVTVLAVSLPWALIYAVVVTLHGVVYGTILAVGGLSIGYLVTRIVMSRMWWL